MHPILIPFPIKFDIGGCLGGSLGAPWVAFGPRTQNKPKKKHLWGVLFDDLLIIFSNFSSDCFCVFFTPLSSQVVDGKSTSRPQFRRHLGAMFEIIWTNREKWKLRFRTRLDMKIKLSRHVFSWFSWILWACFLDVSFSGPFCNFLACFTFSCSHFDSVFDEILQSFWQWFSSTKKSKKSDCRCSPAGGTQGPS